MGTLLVLCRLSTEYYYTYKNLEEIKQSATTIVLKQNVFSPKKRNFEKEDTDLFIYAKVCVW